MIQNEEYIEFDIKALFFHILRKWKPLLAWGLIFAFLLGGWMAYSEYNTSVTVDTGSGYWMEYQQYQDQIATYEGHIAVTQAHLDTLQQYMDESILMRLDPRNAYRSKAVYYIDSGYQILPEYTYQNPDKTETLAWYYRRYLTNYTVYEEIATEIGMDTKYLIELVEVSLPNESTLYISVRHPSLEGSVQITDMIQEKIDGATKELSETIGTHTITLMEDSCGAYIDDSLKDIYKQTEEEMMELQDDLLKYAQELREIKEGPAPAELNIASAFVKWFIIGGVLGVVLVVAYLFLKAFTSNRVYDSAQLVSGFHAEVLGEVICSGDKLSPMARRINSLEGCLTENTEGNLEYIAEKIKRRCGDATNIVVCCDTESGVNHVVADKLAQYLPGIHLVPTGNLLKEAAALRALDECDAVVFVAERDASQNSVIKKVMKVLSSYNKELAGFILCY